VVYANRQITEVLGHAADIFPGKSGSFITSLIHPDDRERMFEPSLRYASLRDGEIYELEYRVRHADGSYRWLHNRDVIFSRADDGRPQVILGVVEDVTARKAAEDTLRDSEERLRLALDAGNLATWDWDLVNNTVIRSDRMYEFLGVSPDAEGNEHARFDHLTHLDDVERVNRAAADAIENKSPFHVEFRIVQPGGDVRWLTSGGQVKCDASGKPIRMVGATIDITDRKRIEEDLRVSEDRTRGILQWAMDAIITVDQGQRITFFNEAAERMFQCTSSETLGHPIDRFIPARYRDKHQQHIQRFGETGVSSRAMGDLGSLSGIRSDGEEFPIEASISQTEVRGTKVYAVILRDISERVHAEAELGKRVKEIESLNARLQRSMSETHHRVKNSLQVITALVDMQVMQNREQQSVPVDQLRRISQHIRALASIHDLLTQQAKSSAEVDDLSVQDALERLLPMVEEMLTGRKVVLNVQNIRLPIRQGTSFFVLLNELISNSIKHGAGDIELTFQVAGGSSELIVADQGPGFSEDFNVLRAANTGLDLVESLSKWDLEGSVRYENRPEGGARVIVQFPLPK
jgi:PAS domain S-box-containing protein